ncbi:hypothetical protein [Mycobacteroides abscessus]|uniref:Uncharacterized protein n=6 Tax=Mycobacteroides abscessus TaxID=36809 RepID=A0A1U3JQ24_9MYCO|nr:hypothetical protein [Mycobacteroides abscessus]ESV57652.1 hypothetical protein L830_3483 [Mycobacteroides abscessus MAB_082312_2258]ESV61058.1 hypothetical protein L833_3443 [Mycobacteroides abscessus MAB_091912_2446]EUA67774.1 hypothetical protein I540_5665 [Mycobacteroides abscessus subsp. bolletii 1513]AGM31460.1 hypothetical protein MASS_4858 [Mycobacteroides abscessus subsp. bolletii 50594]AIC70997.1 hypothetical protein MYCMA_02955 [Mycobacteroides abscessus subsp. massiliense str. G
MIEIGSTFRRRGADGTWATFTIRVIRYSPFPYVEAEPVGGGPRVALSVRAAEGLSAAGG